MWEWHEGMGWWMAFGSFWMIVFWVALIVVIAWVIKKLAEPKGKSSDEMSKPMDIAKERYAKGEITKEEFEQIKKDLKTYDTRS